MSFFDSPFEGKSTQNTSVNLSTSTSTSSTALLSSIRQERIQRDRQRKEEHAALAIQRVWRGRREARILEARWLDELERGDGGVGSAGMVGMAFRGGWERGRRDGNDRRRRMRGVMVSLCGRWAEQGGLVRSIRAEEDWSIKLGVVVLHILSAVLVDPPSADSAVLLSALESVFDGPSWSGLDAGAAASCKEELVQALAKGRWVEKLVEVLEALIAASLPKKKHPHLVPVIRLVTAPLDLTPNSPSSLHEALLHTLLAVPSLPTSIPIPSLSYISNHLPIFTTLLPLGASSPGILHSGRLSTELGKTYLLGNLTTFGITGGMLARYGLEGATNWIKVIGTLLGGMSEGWGKWADGQVEEEQVLEPMILDETGDGADSDEDAPVPGPSNPRPKVHVRPPLPANIQKKVIQITSSAHLTTLSETLLSPSAPSALLYDFARFALSLLNAFRGSPKWEIVLDTFISGTKGRALEKRIWREGVRGKWSGDAKCWDTFVENPSTPCLLFLTHVYNHYLLVTPDDEFFDTQKSNPFTLDEVLELAGIWRDLSYFAFTNGVQALSRSGDVRAKGHGSEDERALLVRGVVRVAERNARRKFADDDFWVMVPSKDLKGFVEAAVYEDAELANAQDADIDTTSLPLWARQRQKYSKRQMAYISPRLGLLNNMPMAVPFTTRLQIFRNFIWKDKQRTGVFESRRLKAKIRRDRLAEDGFDQLADVGAAFKGEIYIKFYDQWGNREEGIDGGGLFKEFLTSLSKQVFDTNRGLWLFTDENQLYPNPHSYATEAHQLRWYAFIGRVLGKALYEGLLVDVSFADFFLAKWLGRQSYLDDLASLDGELYKGLIILKNYPKPEELALNFTITEEEFGATRTIDLVPNGADIPVNAYNKNEYIQLVCRHKLDRQISAQSRAFFSGLSDIIDSKWLRMFDQRELRQLIGGEETIIDVDDLKAHCEVSGFPSDDTMRMFWRVVKGFDQGERRALLSFVTSCSRPPLLGFAYLNPKFGVRYSSSDPTRLPSASACFNLLKLPAYQDEQSMRAKLLQAITSGAGFGLS